MRVVIAAAVLAATCSGAVAQDQPITSPQDAQCRDEARDKVFAAPNPKGLTPFALGAEIYHACMRRLGVETNPPRE
ncbi:hypothetical protein [Methylobacterium sp. J-067]|uniref:hypothetical protein n=1 Tax=Methylobacterium sp. J-067 TaxID=2836648 RepID=UPI001FBB2A1F|nr:hypothetical protein [Methylobacterium sp. J-067]MCJ2023636.1 hypothetical protein [Methylobacterium sp. J-067]